MKAPEQLALPDLTFGTPTGLWTWPRWRVLRWCGSDNPAYTHGRSTRPRRAVEKRVNAALRNLMSFHAVVLKRKIAALPSGSRGRAEWVLEQLTEFWPARWARADERRHVRQPNFYIPPRALPLARRWLRWWRELQRLVLFSTSLMTGLTPPSTTGGQEDSTSGTLFSQKQRVRTALERYQAHCERTGLTWHAS